MLLSLFGVTTTKYTQKKIQFFPSKTLRTTKNARLFVRSEITKVRRLNTIKIIKCVAEKSKILNVTQSIQKLLTRFTKMNRYLIP